MRISARNSLKGTIVSVEDFAPAGPFDLCVTASERKGRLFHLEVIKPVDAD